MSIGFKGNGTGPIAEITHNAATIATVEADKVTFLQPVIAPNLFGVGQTRQILTGSRSLGSVNTNSTGKIIEVAVSVTLTGASGTRGGVEIDINGVLTYSDHRPMDSSNNSCIIQMVFSVLDGETYKVRNPYGVLSSFRWVETR